MSKITSSIMAEFTTSTERKPIEFMADICTIISDYADVNNINVLKLVTAIYHNIKKNSVFTINTTEHQKISSDDDFLTFIYKIVEAIVHYSYTYDLDVEDTAGSIWYAISVIYMEDTYGDLYYKATTNKEKDEEDAN